MAHTVRRIARANATKANAYTGPAGELLMNTTDKELRLHDGTTRGGLPILDKAQTTNLVNSIIAGQGGGETPSGGDVAPANSIFPAVSSPFIDDPREWLGGTPMCIGSDVVGVGLKSRGVLPATAPSNQWDRASQQGSCDVHENVLYIPGENSAGQSFIYAVKWSELESERVLLGMTAKTYGIVPHQCLCIYRPKDTDTLYFIGPNPGRTTSGASDYTARKVLNIFTWDYHQDNSAPVLVKALQAFDSSVYDDNLIGAATSLDGSILILRARKRSNDADTFRVYNLHAIMDGTITNLQTQFLYQFDTSAGFGGQGIYTDGRFIYADSTASETNLDNLGGRSACVQCYTLDGHRVTEAIMGVLEQVKSRFTYPYQAEFEGMFTAPLYGKYAPIMMISYCEYYNGNTTDYYRSNFYFAPTVGNLDASTPAGREMYLQRDLRARFRTSKLNEPYASGWQRLIGCLPQGNGDIDVVMGGEGSSYFCSGEASARVYDALNSLYLANQQKQKEELWLYADGRIHISAGHGNDTVTDAGAYLNDANTFFGLSFTNENNAFLTQDNPAFLLTYAGVNLGSGPSTTLHSRLAFTTNNATANTGYFVGCIQHHIYTDGTTQMELLLRNSAGATTTNFDDTRWKFLEARLYANGDKNLFVDSNVVPQTSAANDLGSTSRKFNNIYCNTVNASVINGTVNVSSDVRLKQDITDLSDKEHKVALACKALIKCFKFNSEVQTDSVLAPKHVGVIAQELMHAFEIEGLDAMSYGIVHHTVWDDEFAYKEDAEGNAVRYLSRAAGDEYSINYSELLCFIIAAM